MVSVTDICLIRPVRKSKIVLHRQIYVNNHGHSWSSTVKHPTRTLAAPIISEKKKAHSKNNYYKKKNKIKATVMMIIMLVVVLVNVTSECALRIFFIYLIGMLFATED